MGKERLSEIGILRGIAFLAVVLQHAFAGIFYLPHITAIELTIGNTFLGLTRFAVPLFVFITGVVLFYNYDDKFNYKRFVKKRFVQVIIPYIVWSFFYYIWLSFLQGFAPSSTLNETWDILNVICTGQAEYHLWFMVMIIPFYFLFPIFKPLLSKSRSYIINLGVLVVSFIINMLLLYALSEGMFVFNNIDLKFIFNYLDRNFIFWTFYFILGGFVGIHYNKWLKFVKNSMFIVVPLLISMVYYIYLKIAEFNLVFDENSYYLSSGFTSPLKPFTMVLSIVSIIILFYIAGKIANSKNSITKVLNVCGKYSFGAYLIHAFVLRFTNSIVINSLDLLNPYMQTLVSFTICSLISLLICHLISKITISFGEIVIGKV